MSAWTGKVCQNCGRKKSKSRTHLKYCTSCDRGLRKQRALAAHDRRVAETKGISGADYWAIYKAQGGRCALCQRAQGKKKRLAVDHDHHCTEGHDAKYACRKCVRGLLCVNCNRNVLGRAAHDDPEFFLRGYEYLMSPPARAILDTITGAQYGGRGTDPEGGQPYARA